MHAIDRERKPKGAGGGGDTGSEMSSPLFPSHAPRGGRFGGAVGGLNEQTIPAIPWWAGGQTPSSLHLLLPQPVPSGLPAQPSPAGWDPWLCQPRPARGGSGLRSGVCEGLCCFFVFLYLLFAFRALIFPSPEALTPYPVPASGCLVHPYISATTCPGSPASFGLRAHQGRSASAPWVEAGGPGIWRGWLSALATLGP